MAEIAAAIVKELRERTGAGMMDCKRALSETAGDLDKAIEFLREKGLAAAAKKAGRIAAEGLVASYLTADKKIGSLVEVNCETDFVAKNPDFQQLATEVAQVVAEQDPADLEALAQLVLASGQTVAATLTGLVAKIGENMAVRRFARFAADANGSLDSYIHMGGKIGVLIELSASDPALLSKGEFQTLTKDLAMQVAAAKPEYVVREQVPAEVLAQEQAIYKAQAMNEGKPEAIAEKVTLGRIQKFYKEVCLTEQLFIKDNEQTIAKLLQDLGTKLGGASITVKRFARFEKGEGIEKKSADFAGEVMAQINK